MAGTLFANVRLFDGATFVEGTCDVLVREGRVASIGPDIGAPDAERIDGGTLFPGFVDAHVHLSFATADAVAAGGVTTVIDLGEPEAFAFAEHPPLTVRTAGPMLTAPRGYPTRSWGAGGYGLELHDAREAREAVAFLADRGAGMIKVAIEPAGGPILDADVMTAVTGAAHARSLLVAAHALGAASVATALDAEADVLAHTPVEPLPHHLAGAVAKRGIAVLSTIRAFGSARSTLENLAALASAGVRIAYGTDLGNDGIRPGLDVDELEMLAGALGGAERALAAATSVAGEYARYGGRVEPGAPADLVWVAAYEKLGDLRGAKVVWKNGTRLT